MRKCQLCNHQDIDDEYLFLLICPVYSDIRQKYISKSYFVRWSVYKFVCLMDSSDTLVLKKLDRYLDKSFKSKVAIQIFHISPN